MCDEIATYEAAGLSIFTAGPSIGFSISLPVTRSLPVTLLPPVALLLPVTTKGSGRDQPCCDVLKLIPDPPFASKLPSVSISARRWPTSSRYPVRKAGCWSRGGAATLHFSPPLYYFCRPPWERVAVGAPGGARRADGVC